MIVQSIGQMHLNSPEKSKKSYKTYFKYKKVTLIKQKPNCKGKVEKPFLRGKQSKYLSTSIDKLW